MSSKNKQGSKTKNFAAVQGNFKEFAKIVSKVSSQGAEQIRVEILHKMDAHIQSEPTFTSGVSQFSRHYFVNRLEKFAWRV